MNMPTATEMTSIGLDDNAPLSRDLAASLLRTCSTPGKDERTYSNVALQAVPNGQRLFVNAPFGNLMFCG